MARKVLSAVLTLKDKDFSTNMKKASGGIGDFQRKVKYTKNSINDFSKSAASSFSSVAKSAIGIAGAYVGFKSLNNFKNESVELAKAQVQAETKLAAVMKNTKGVTDQQIEGVKKYASELQNVGVIGDEVQISGVQQLATYQLQADTLKKLMPGMNDLIAQQKGVNATQEDAVGIGNMIGKVMAGQVGALSRAGINFTKAQEQVLKYGTESERAAMLAEVLKQNVGGVNAALAETDEGKIQQMTNAWGDYKEEIGKKILPLQAQFAGWFVKKIPGIQSMVLGLVDKGVSAFDKAKKPMTDMFNAIKPGLTWIKDVGLPIIKENISSIFTEIKPILGWLKDTGLPALAEGFVLVNDASKNVYRFIKDNWPTIEPIVYGIAGAIAAYKIGMIATTTATKTWTAVTAAMTTAQGLLNGTLAISPLGWVAIAIGTVIAVGVLLYRNWDTIKEKGLALWDGLNGVFTSIGAGFSNMWTGMKDGAKAGINFIIDGLNSMITGFNNFASFQVPEWVPGIGGKGWELSIPKIPKFALGTSYFTGGLAQINERGGEIVDLPNGSRIYPHDKSVQMARQSISGKSIYDAELSELIKLLAQFLKNGHKNEFKVYISGVNKSVEEIMNELVPKLQLTLSNM